MKIEFNNTFNVDLVSGEEFYKLCKWSLCPRYDKQFYFNVNEVEENDFVFLNLDYANEFINLLNSNNITKKINLITHNSDKSFTEELYEGFKKYVNFIYSINCTICKPNIIKIPLGFVDNRYKPHKELISILDENISKTIFVYLNFSIETNKKERQECFDILKNKKFIYSEFNIPPKDFYKKNRMSKYIISPDGTGIDCHRIYESIYYDSIPIIKKNKLSDFYENLPVLIVNSWDEINEDYLQNKYDELYNKLILWKSKNNWTSAKYWLKFY